MGWEASEEVQLFTLLSAFFAKRPASPRDAQRDVSKRAKKGKVYRRKRKKDSWPS